MILTFDIGNSHICGGIFAKDELLLQFRYDSKQIGTSDELGVFIRNVLRENNIDYHNITQIGAASVVPSIDYTLRAACIKYFQQEPLFLKPGIKTGIQIKTHNPNEVGADLIAGAAKTIYPNQDVLIFDLGTATTATYLNKHGEFMGAAFAPGIKLMMESLHSNTAKLMNVDITKPIMAIGKNTKSSIQSGIYYATFGLMEELIVQTKLEYALTDNLITIGTGGFSSLFNSSHIFTNTVPELVLLGIKHMLSLN
jgi:type III pantothenate kinase